MVAHAVVSLFWSCWRIAQCFVCVAALHFVVTFVCVQRNMVADMDTLRKIEEFSLHAAMMQIPGCTGQCKAAHALLINYCGLCHV